MTLIDWLFFIALVIAGLIAWWLCMKLGEWIERKYLRNKPIPGDLIEFQGTGFISKVIRKMSKQWSGRYW